MLFQGFSQYANTVLVLQSQSRLLCQILYQLLLIGLSSLSDHRGGQLGDMTFHFHDFCFFLLQLIGQSYGLLILLPGIVFRDRAILNESSDFLVGPCSIVIKLSFPVFP